MVQVGNKSTNKNNTLRTERFVSTPVPFLTKVYSLTESDLQLNSLVIYLLPSSWPFSFLLNQFQWYIFTQCEGKFHNIRWLFVPHRVTSLSLPLASQCHSLQLRFSLPSSSTLCTLQTSYQPYPQPLIRHPQTRFRAAFKILRYTEITVLKQQELIVPYMNIMCVREVIRTGGKQWEFSLWAKLINENAKLPVFIRIIQKLKHSF